MISKVNGVVLRAVDYNDNDKMLTLFTLEKGVLGAKIKGVKKAGAKLKFAAEPFCFAEYVLSETGERATVTEVTQIDSFYNLRLDLFKYYSATAIVEFINKALYKNEVFEQMFYLTVNTFKTLAYTDADAITALLNFFLNSLSCLGYGMNLHGCISCGKPLLDRAFFDFDAGGATCENCRKTTDVEFNVNTYKYLLEALNGFADGQKPTVDNLIKKKAIRLIDYFISLKIGITLTSTKEIMNML